MKIFLWILQAFLAIAFLGVSFLHSFGAAQAQMNPGMQWLLDVPRPLVLFIALCEFLGALGLILPMATRIRPRLTPLAAALLAVIMLFALVFHITRGEYANIGINLFLGIPAAFVAYGRFVLAPPKTA
jgi:uncharacterized membrane protein YphA (DoxX/SURF4 family)